MKLARYFAIASLVAATPALSQMQLSIATGGTGGVYYPMGGGLAEVINNHVDGYSATAEVTGASVENMGLIATGDADFAIGLADTVQQAYTGTGRFEGQQLPMIRAVGSLYANMVQIVTLADSGIEGLDDLKGKRVSVGAPGSGTEVNARTLLEANGISFDDFDAQRLNFNETADALNNGDIDAGFWSVGAPADAADETFAPLKLAGGVYQGVDDEVSTVGVPNVLVVSSEMDADTVYQITKAMYENIADMQAVHPAANETTIEFSMNATPVPLHPGALRYFEEAGATVPDHLRP